MADKNFWKNISFNEFSPQQWESICDGCGRCCLIKLQDEETDQICTTNVACRYLDLENNHCTKYLERTTLVPSCVKLTPENLSEQFYYMPQSCSYRLLYETGDLPEWHPLKSGSHSQMNEMGISIQYLAVSEATIEDEEQLFDHIIDCEEFDDE
ncbi:MAG: YcgN family cysteine cluster protein [Gammaproteobacteria bacterium]|nr:YcgN family cysteine cluster protein [Gammaproteobacteria bacterium]